MKIPLAIPSNPPSALAPNAAMNNKKTVESSIEKARVTKPEDAVKAS